MNSYIQLKQSEFQKAIKAEKNNFGYTLIELLVVISIISFIASSGLYTFNSAREKGRIAGLLRFSDGIRASLSDSPVSYWSFDNGGATDSWGQNHGTVIGADCTVAGVVGNACDFNGSNDYIDFGSPNLGIFGFTYCAWIYPKTMTGGNIIMHYTNAIDNDSLGIRMASNGILDVFDGNNSLITTVSPVTVNNWNHICFTSEGLTDDSTGNDTIKAYINGALDKTSTRDYNPYIPSNNLYIANPIWSNANFNGLIDEVQIYSEGLPFAQIQKLYAEGAKKFQVAIK